jgi:hypothetical protein
MGADMQARKLEVNEAGKLTGPHYWEVINVQDTCPETYLLAVV